MPRCLVFDFDGTLVDSNHVKDRAFFDVFDGLNARQEVEEVLREQTDLDRGGIVAEVLRRLELGGQLPRECDAGALAQQLVEEYGRLADEAVNRAAEIPGATAALRHLNGRHLMYVASATPEDALRRAVTTRGWSGFFEGVYGRPSRKPEILRRICAAHALTGHAVAMIGDRSADRDAARALGCHFIGVGEDSGAEAPDLRIPNLEHLPAVVEALVAEVLDARC
jgi:phosphoglycolate phosphatase-like HAD superfamily hydrolase